MEGLSLLKTLIEATGLPAAAVEREVSQILAKKNLKPEALTLEDVREVLSAYLQDVLLEAKESAG